MKTIIKAISDRLTGKVPLLARRSPHWPSVRAAHLKSNPSCAACGTSEKLEVHHCVPFHLNKSLELLDSNLITLCEADKRCHLTVGHHGNWKNENPAVREEAAALLATRQAK